MAVVNYPHETDYMAPLPAWPVAAACARAIEAIPEANATEFDYLKALSAVYHTFGWRKCLNESTDIRFYSTEWDFFECNNLYYDTLYSTDGVTDMFYKSEYTKDGIAEYCFQ
jgi:lysosomal Pro-X carboxypeptidase